LSRFQPGEVYDVSTSLGSYLLSERLAEPVADDSPALVVPLNEVRSLWTDEDPVRLRGETADRRRRRFHLVGNARKRQE
jgi:hypothetical protein